MKNFSHCSDTDTTFLLHKDPNSVCSTSYDSGSILLYYKRNDLEFAPLGFAVSHTF